MLVCVLPMKSKQKFSYDVVDSNESIATQAGLVYDIINADCWSQKSSPTCFHDFQMLLFNIKAGIFHS